MLGCLVVGLCIVVRICYCLGVWLFGRRVACSFGSLAVLSLDWSCGSLVVWLLVCLSVCLAGWSSLVGYKVPGLDLDDSQYTCFCRRIRRENEFFKGPQNSGLNIS